jgi:hypothetical protein
MVTIARQLVANAEGHHLVAGIASRTDQLQGHTTTSCPVMCSVTCKLFKDD